MFFVAQAQTVRYPQELMATLEARSHVVGGVLLASNLPPAALEPQVARALADADPNMAVLSIRTLGEQMARTFAQERALPTLAACLARLRCCWPASDSTVRPLELLTILAFAINCFSRMRWRGPWV